MLAYSVEYLCFFFMVQEFVLEHDQVLINNIVTESMLGT